MKIFKISKADNHLILNILGLKFKFKQKKIDQLAELCCIPDLDSLKAKGTKFVHPIGIVIIKGAEFGNNCTIFQNVTIGKWHGKAPKIGNNVTFYPNSVVFGDIEIGDNVIIGAGSVVTKSVPANKVVAGNPAKIIKDVTDFDKEKEVVETC